MREEMTKVWKKVYEANYHKSLDHRSFYFKQAEKKMLLPKTLVRAGPGQGGGGGGGGGAEE